MKDLLQTTLDLVQALKSITEELAAEERTWLTAEERNQLLLAIGNAQFCSQQMERLYSIMMRKDGVS